MRKLSYDNPEGGVSVISIVDLCPNDLLSTCLDVLPAEVNCNVANLHRLLMDRVVDTLMMMMMMMMLCEQYKTFS